MVDMDVVSWYAMAMWIDKRVLWDAVKWRVALILVVVVLVGLAAWATWTFGPR